MTLNDIIVAALAQLDRGHDAQSLDIWRDKFTRFANEAVGDLALCCKPRKVEELTIEDGLLSTEALEKECVRIMSITQGGRPLEFTETDMSGVVRVHGGRDSVPTRVSYRFMPAALSSPTDVPELPERLHPLIVTYVVGRERASSDVAVQRGGNIYFEMYRAGKAAISPNCGGADSFRIENRW